MGSEESMPGYSGDFSTDYDSTWEDDDDCKEDQSGGLSLRWSSRAHRNIDAARDMQNFRRMIRRVQWDDIDDKKLNKLYFEEKSFFPNLRFYQNRIKARPDDVYIEEIHSTWFGDYRRLEKMHSYIQWLFPNQEQGTNSDAHALTPEEIKLFSQSKTTKEKLLKSYRLTLDFYGMKLLDEKTGEVCRADNWKERFENLDSNTKHSRCITRILKSLGILGFQHYQAPLVHFFLKETLVHGNLPSVKRSVLDYFIFSVLDRSERKVLIRFAFEKFEPKDEFVWCPKRIQRRFFREMNH